jgi:hypothetical protein
MHKELHGMENVVGLLEANIFQRCTVNRLALSLSTEDILPHDMDVTTGRARHLKYISIRRRGPQPARKHVTAKRQ